MRPRGPNEKMKAIDVVNGGEISGSKAAASRRRQPVAGRKPARARGQGEQEAQRRAHQADQRCRGSGCSAKAARWLGSPRIASSGARREAALVDEGAPTSSISKRIEHEQRQQQPQRRDA